MIEALLIAISVLMVLACAAFVAAEFSFITVDRAHLDKDVAEGNKKSARVLRAIESLSTHLSSAQIGITLTNLIIGFLAEPTISKLLEPLFASIGLGETTSLTVAFLIAFLLANGITMIFGELVPKNLAIAHPLRTSRAVVRFQTGFTTALSPAVRGANALANFVLKRFGIEPQEELASARSAQELSSLIKHSSKQGSLHADVAHLLDKSIRFGELRANDAMTSRVKTKIIQADQNITAALALAHSSGHSRFPVVNGNSSRVIGVVHLIEMVRVPAEARDDTKVKSVMIEPLLVPSTIELDDLLEELRESGIESAVVVDEYGDFDGVVTLEDLVEELVGEVLDEHDSPVSDAVESEDGSWHLSGLLRVDEVFERTGILLPENEDYDTIGGLVFYQFGKIAGVDDTVSVLAENENHEKVEIELKVISLEGLRIDQVEMKTGDLK